MMNDFTKEELERIIEGISLWLDGDDALYSQQLINKIQSMIDNYCEHEWHTNSFDFILYCSQCGITKISNKQEELKVIE